MNNKMISPEIQAIIAKYPVLNKAFETGVESHDGREEALLSFIQSHPNHEELRNNPQGILDAMDDFSARHDFLISIGRQKSGVIKDLLTKESWKGKGKMVVELGGYLGYSAILFADALRSFGQRGVQIFSLELNEQFAAIASKFIELAGFCDLITVVVGPAASSLRALVSSRKLEKVDLLFLDHAEEMYVDDFKVCEGLGLLGRGSVVVADNVVRPGAPLYRELVREMQNEGKVRSVGVRGLVEPGSLEDELEVTWFL